MDKEWMPEVGDKVMALRVYEVTIKAKDGDVFICKHRDGDGINDYKGYKLHQLSPIKTEADKAREEQIEKIADALLDAGAQDVPEDIARGAYDAGCRILKPNQFIGTKLSNEQIDALYINHFAGMNRDAYERIVLTAQREIAGGE